MNKQELIEHISNVLDKYLNNTTFVKPVLSITETANSDKVSLEFEIGKNCILLDDVSYRFGYDKGKLDGEWVGQQLKDADKIRQELNKPVVPQFVADWLNENDWREETLGKQSVFDVLGNLKNDSKNGYYENVKRWIDENGDLFARAWLDGYTVEEKRYTVKIKAILGQYLERYYLNNEELTPQFKRTQPTGRDELPTFTRKELEEAGFGWVFDCEGVEVEEVE